MIIHVVMDFYFSHNPNADSLRFYLPSLQYPSQPLAIEDHLPKVLNVQYYLLLPYSSGDQILRQKEERKTSSTNEGQISD
jgi:hypothetical protein